MMPQIMPSNVARRQLHRLAHKELGHARWPDCTKSVPITEPDAILAGLDILDPSHPILVSQNSSGIPQRSDETSFDNAEQTRQEPDEVSSINGPLERDMAPVQHHRL